MWELKMIIRIYLFMCGVKADMWLEINKNNDKGLLLSIGSKWMIQGWRVNKKKNVN